MGVKILTMLKGIEKMLSKAMKLTEEGEGITGVKLVGAHVENAKDLLGELIKELEELEEAQKTRPFRVNEIPPIENSEELSPEGNADKQAVLGD